ncbi:hypothetical protein J2Y69_002479 [Microbacterium resistens]|uniref:Uncharacterized protein n=1 Tax=Microbacterium resistens TaxID=156977 RepID=A0ABU1SE34_9MICO|nr:hypothetical protein [Microbacterium resistens]MDR6867871.1 hypothetical protein [Microbacterium resistens]
MSASLVERARAFAVIADYLPNAKQREIAEALGERILSELKPPSGAPSGAGLFADPPVVDLSPHTEVASFLVDKGLQGAELVKATGKLTSFLAGPDFAHLTKQARMQTWWAARHDREAGT